MAHRPTLHFLSVVAGALLWIFSACSFAQASEVIRLNNSDEMVQITNPDYLIVSGIHSISEVTSDDLADQWRPFKEKDETSLGKDTAIWFRFELQPDNLEHLEWVLSAKWSLLEHVQLFVYNHATETWWQSRPVGTLYPHAERYNPGLYFDFPLTLPADTPVTAYLNIKSNNLLSIPLFLSTNDALEEHYVFEYFLLGILFGSLLVMLFYNFCLYFLLRDQAYLYYTVYIVTVIIYELHLTGIGIAFLWDGNAFLKNSLSFFASLSVFAATIFIRKFLELRNHGKIVSRSSLAINWLWGILPFAALIFRDEGWFKVFYSLAVLASCFAGLLFALYLSMTKSIAARIFLLAWFFIIVGTIVFIMAIYGQLPVNLFTRYSQMVGFIIELVLLSFALAYRINEAKRNREAAQTKALQLAETVNLERSERIKAQLETLEIHKQLNDELEHQVKVRTQQLEEALTQLRGANNELTELTITDSLTTVHNRRFFDDALVTEYRRAFRNEQTIAIIIIDIDHFKAVNDTYGHSVGDDAIRLVAKALEDKVRRPGDVVARYGGEEFAMLLPNCDLDDALKIANACRERVAAIVFSPHGKIIPLTISAGVAAWKPTSDNNHKQLIVAADTALYRAKNAGRNRVEATELASKVS